MRTRPAWTSKYKHNWDEAYNNMMAWWQGESIRRPVVLSAVQKPDATPFCPSKDPGSNQQRDLDEQYQFEKNHHNLVSKIYSAESIPAVKTSFASSIGMLAGMAGAELKYDNRTAWVETIDNLYEKPLPEFSQEYSPYRITTSLIDRHATFYGYDCIIGSDAMMDPITILSMMRGVENLCLDLYDRLDDVMRWLKRLSEIRFQLAQGYQNTKARHGRHEEVNWTAAWAPEEMECLECDFSTMISNEMFNDIVMPEVEKEASYYKYCLWHLDGLAEIKHLDSLCSIKNIYAVQWIADKQDGPLNYIDLFKKIRSYKKSLLITCSSPEEALRLTKEIGKDGLALLVGGLKTLGDMETLLRQLENI